MAWRYSLTSSRSIATVLLHGPVETRQIPDYSRETGNFFDFPR
jgi:hypothetical protein